jgi:hypothetical protein
VAKGKKIAIFPKMRTNSVTMTPDCAIVLDPDAKNLKLYGEALAEVVQREIKAISTPPARSTVKRRGPGKLFNVTGYLRRRIRLRRARKGWEVQAPVGRLEIEPIRKRLLEVAPNLGNADRLVALARGQLDVRGFLRSTVYKKKGWFRRAFGFLRGGLG